VDLITINTIAPSLVSFRLYPLPPACTWRPLVLRIECFELMPCITNKGIIIVCVSCGRVFYRFIRPAQSGYQRL
jgi:hypothetical protein